MYEKSKEVTKKFPTATKGALKTFSNKNMQKVSPDPSPSPVVKLLFLNIY